MNNYEAITIVTITQVKKWNIGNNQESPPCLASSQNPPIAQTITTYLTFMLIHSLFFFVDLLLMCTFL